MPVSIDEALTADDRAACLAIRDDVFCREQGVSPEVERDGRDDLCRHYLAQDDRTPVGTARVRPVEGGDVKLERIAVLRAHRHKSIGSALVRRALHDAVMSGRRSALLHAQSGTEGFYEALGFARDGDEFLEAGIRHVLMRQDLVRGP